MYWTGGTDPIKFDGINEDDRRLGGILRVWDTQQNNGEIQVAGTGTYLGPLSIYDPIESTDADDLYYASRKQIPTTPDQSIRIDCSTPGNETLGPNTVHRVHTIDKYNTSMYSRNANDVVVSAYTAGCRVLNLTETATNATTLEKGFFDFIPKLNYNKNSEYFYKIASLDLVGLAQYQRVRNIGMYFMGVWHSVADFGTDRVGTTGTSTLPEDEKFIHVMGFGEGRIITDPSNSLYTVDPAEVQDADGRNWISDGGFMMLRYFDGKLGGTIKGYEGTGTKKWSSRPYQTINLQGVFDVQRDVTIAPGACVQLLPGHENDPGIFSSTSLASSTGKKIIVEGVLNVSIPEGDAKGTDIVINVPIEIKSGGVMNVYGIRSGKRVIFKKMVTCSSGGTWKMHPSADVELYATYHESHGKFIVDGDEEVDKRVRITSRRNGTSYSEAAHISGRGSLDNSASLVQIEYAEIVNTFMGFNRIAVAPQYTIRNSEFRATHSFSGIFQFALMRPLSTRVPSLGYDRRVAQVRITDSKFWNANTEVQPRKSHYNGVYVYNAFQVNLTNVELDQLRTGALLVGNSHVRILDCKVSKTVFGVQARNGSFFSCNNLYDGNEFATSVYGTGKSHYRDNAYTSMFTGATILNSGIQLFRRNSFQNYCNGITSWGSTVFMRNEIRPGNDFEYGRNDFLGGTSNIGNCGSDYVDVQLADGASLVVDCGYNKFSANSVSHVNSDGTCPDIDVSYNQWNPGPAYEPRFNGIGFTGTPRDVQQDPAATCLYVVNNHVCGAIVCPPSVWQDQDNEELVFRDTLLYPAAASIRADVTNASLAWRCRRDKAWEYFEVVSKIDSSSYWQQLKSDMQTIASSTSLDTNLRSGALFIKASAHSHLFEYDSARTVLATIMSQYPMHADSVPANWDALYLNAIQDTTGKTDSLIEVYLTRVVDDLRRKSAYSTSGLAKRMLTRETGSEQGTEIKLGDVTYPNPANSGTVYLNVEAGRSQVCFVEIVSTTGMVERTYDFHLLVGDNHIALNTADLSPGVYIARIGCDNVIKSVTFVITR